MYTEQESVAKLSNLSKEAAMQHPTNRQLRDYWRSVTRLTGEHPDYFKRT